MTTTVELLGWRLVHTWVESHGEGRDNIYQKEMSFNELASRTHINVLVLSYHRTPDVRGRSLDIRTEVGNNYLLAKYIKEHSDEFSAPTPKNVSACYTAERHDVRHLETDMCFRVVQVAGHGEWAYRIDPSEFGKRVRE